MRGVFSVNFLFDFVAFYDKIFILSIILFKLFVLYKDIFYIVPSLYSTIAKKAT